MDQSRVTNVADARSDRGTGGLAIKRVDPREHAAEITQLFVAHERREFPAFFDRAYRDAPVPGCTSWIGCDEDHRVQAYIAQLPAQFRLGGRAIRSALLANLMVAERYRSFWPAFALVRRVVRDAKESGTVDFLYADPNEPAQGVLQAAGFRPVGALQRFLLPLRDVRRGVDAGIRLYNLIARWRAKPTPLVLTERRGLEPPEPLEAASPVDPASLGPVRRATLYRRRLSGYPGPSDAWYRFSTPRSPQVATAEALVRTPDGEGGRATVWMLACEQVALLRSVLLALAQRLRDAGATGLHVWVMAGSRAAQEARRAGFLPREDRIPIMALPLTALGAEATAAATQWQLQLIDLDR